jgi:dipeptidyl aminopeptidase/acylaminoacyl peptidase
MDFLDREGQVLIREFDRDRRWNTTYFYDLAKGDESKRVVFDLSVNDAYANPGSPVYQTKPDGTRTIIQDGDTIYLSGRGATPAGDRPFLDAFDLNTKATKRLFQSGEDELATFVAFVGRNGPAGQVLITRQSRTSPPNYYLDGDKRVAVTDFKDPHPQITGISKQLLKYKRADGVPLSGTLYLPPGYDKARDGKLPVVVWAYPQEFSDGSTAGQVRGSDNTFTRLAGTSPIWFVTQGYAVLMDATMPVVGDPETMNDTFVEQITAAAKAAIDTLDEMGVGDRKRVVVSGHSYGGFMTANLLTHTDLFAAGIARSGAYNRTLTPFGFQSERRDFWEARDVYIKLSPFTWANQIKRPLLLIHGAEDDNPGTYTVQSERLFDAIRANGGTSRLVLLPHEAHGYRAKESVLHTLAEMFEWADKYAKYK